MKDQAKTIAVLASLALSLAQTWGQVIAVPTFGAISTPPATGPYSTFGGFWDLAPSATFGSGGGWTVTAGSVDLINTLWQPPPDGLQNVDMDGASVGQISTLLTIPAAGSVTVSFYLSGNPNGPPDPKDLGVTLGSSAQQTTTYTLTGNDNNMFWTTVSMVFANQAAGPETLTITSLDGVLGAGGDWGPVVGTVTAYDAPSGVPDGGMTATLLGMGVAGLAGLRRRFGA